MKKHYGLYLAYLLMFSLTFIVVNCTKEGPAGAAGADGADGIDGTDGTDGVDGNAACLECHTLSIMNGIHNEYKMSGHFAGLYVGFAGARNDCAACHSHEGFIETQHTGMDTTAADIPIPTAFNCKTCHNDHVTLDFENDGRVVPLRAVEPVALLMFNKERTIDQGNSNLCATCHQPRRSAPEDNGSGEFVITNNRYGPHHGPHSTVLQGIGGYEHAGGTYPSEGSNTHLTASSCIACHMETSADGSTGGHSWNVGINACTSCHPNATDFDLGGKQTEIEDLTTQLETILRTNGIIDEEGSPIPGTYPVDQAGAFYNWITVVDDRSKGVHNYAYIKALLDNSIAAFE